MLKDVCHVKRVTHPPRIARTIPNQFAYSLPIRNGIYLTYNRFSPFRRKRAECIYEGTADILACQLPSPPFILIQLLSKNSFPVQISHRSTCTRFIQVSQASYRLLTKCCIYLAVRYIWV